MLLSGRGSNLAAMIKAGLDIRIAISELADADAPGLIAARTAGVPVAIVPRTVFASRSCHETALAQAIDHWAPRVIALAGFMRILSARFVKLYARRLINIHPSLLPMFPGLHTHAQALRTGATVHGCTVHWVSTEVDAGPIIAQAQVPVLLSDTPTQLAARVHAAEHRLYPHVISRILAGSEQHPC